MTRRPFHRAALLGAALLLHACSSGSSAPSVTMPSVDTHGPWFPIAVGAAHGPPAGQATLDCNACHFDKITGQPSASFLQYTCTGCHVPAPVTLHDDLAALDAYHLASAMVAEVTARTGQAYDQHDAACRACHPQGIRDGVDHARHFPLPHRDAAGTTVARCDDCHASRATRDYRVMGCATCHPHGTAAAGSDPALTTKHARVLDYVPLAAGASQAEQDAASAACARCHGDGVVPVKVAAHTAAASGFDVGAGAVHGGAVARCLDCHPALRSDPFKPLAADFKVSSCVGCHVPVGHTATAVDHGFRTQLEPFHLGLTDPTSTPPNQPFPKAQLFASVVDAAVTAAGGDAAKGLSAACLQCHPQGIGAHPYYLLPHQNAARTVVATCEQCHVNPARRADLGCAACHAQVSPVATRHAKVPDVVAADTSVAASAKCARCHEFDAIPTRVATHAPFGIASGAHSGATGGVCLTCHPALKGEPTPWAADFKVRACTGCHVAVAGGRARHDDPATLATLHSGVTDYATKVAALGLSGACQACHPTGVAGPPANHDEYFSLSATSKHVFPSARIKACLDCHTSSDRLNPADFRCAACHAADAVPLATGHAKVPDQLADPTNPVKCLSCHADGRLPATSTKVTVTVAGHATGANGFTVGAGAHAGTAGGSCLTCHPANRLPTTAAPHWQYSRDWKQVTCTGCHVAVGSGRAQHDDQGLTGTQVPLATMHSAASNFAATVASKGLSAACLYCHADGAGGAPANHPQLFPIQAGTKHAGIACASCHTNPANRKDLTALACASCHATHTTATATHKAWSTAHAITGYAITTYQTATTAGGTRTTVTIDMTKPDGCLKCHGDSQVFRVASHPGGDSGFGQSQHRQAGCLVCHWQYRTTGTTTNPAKPWALDFKKYTGSAGPPPTSCYVCHASGTGN
jgi:hypothetical protein